MAQVERKARQEALSRQLHSGQGSHEIKTVLELLQLRMEGVKNAMLTCKPEEFLKYQGEALAYNKVILDITRPPLRMTTTEEK